MSPLGIGLLGEGLALVPCGSNLGRLGIRALTRDKRSGVSVSCTLCERAHDALCQQGCSRQNPRRHRDQYELPERDHDGSARPASQGTVVAAVLSSARCRSFRLKDIPFGPTATPVNQLRNIVQFSVVDRQCVAISMPGKPIVSAKTPTELPESASCHFFVVLPPSGRPDEVRPCWSRRA